MAQLIRIGTLAERVGVSTHALRVWEDRYGLLSPERSAAGYRLYGPEDELRAVKMVRLRSEGVPAARAASEALSAAVERARPVDLALISTDLRTAFRRYDEAALHELLDTALVGHRIDQVIDDLVFPFLRLLGESWERGEISVAQEHWASGLLRSRMTSVASALSTRRSGPARGTAVLACPSHERHDIGLLALDLVLRERGWDCTFLGADTPVDAAVQVCRDRCADVLVLCGSDPLMYDAQLDMATEDLLALPVTTTLALAGRAATAELAGRHHAELLPLATVPAADAVDARVRENAR